VRHSRPGHPPGNLSEPPLLAAPVPIDVGDDDCSLDPGEDFLETYFGGPEPFFYSSEDGTHADYDDVPNYPPFDVPNDPPDSPSVVGFHMHRQEVTAAYVGEPSGRFHLPLATAVSSKSPPQQTEAAPVVSSLNVPRDETLMVKAVLDDVIVVFCAQRNISLAGLHQRLHDKFTRTEGMPLPGAFALAYVPPTVSAGGKHVSTMSSASAESVDWARALLLENEEVWITAVASCGPKITLRIIYPPSNETPKTPDSRGKKGRS
jgi:hypothetical protein